MNELLKDKPKQTTKLYIPLVNLNVESDIKVGRVTIHPAGSAELVAKTFSRLDAVTDVQNNLDKSAFAELEIERSGDKLIPKDRTNIENSIRESMSILYLMQKQIAGRSSVNHQIFGLPSDAPSFQNFIAAIEGSKQSYGFRREGNFAEWSFNNSSIRKIQARDDFQFLSKLAASAKRNDIENRIMKAIGLIYEGALELKPQYRFTKIMTGFEVLLLKKHGSFKKFTLTRQCTMISHAFLHPGIKCLCPILTSNNSDEFTGGLKALNFPYACSAYSDFTRWYKIRCNISHEANIITVDENISSFEWWAYEYFMKIIEVVAQNNIQNLDRLRSYIDQEYQSWREAL
ncbi:MAG: hypothetical protein HQ488_02855 [Parcubacteria group bacterium]|nr:hypothetical protein [Parcubacteria group bacterium]